MFFFSVYFLCFLCYRYSCSFLFHSAHSLPFGLWMYDSSCSVLHSFFFFLYISIYPCFLFMLFLFFFKHNAVRSLSFVLCLYNSSRSVIHLLFLSVSFPLSIFQVIFILVLFVYNSDYSLSFDPCMYNSSLSAIHLFFYYLHIFLRIFFLCKLFVFIFILHYSVHSFHCRYVRCRIPELVSSSLFNNSSSGLYLLTTFHCSV